MGDKVQARKQSTKINFWGSETAGWGGGSSTRRGGGRKVRALPRKFVFSWVLKEGTWDVSGVLPRCPGPLGVFEKLVQKKFVLVFWFQKVSSKTGILICLRVTLCPLTLLHKEAVASPCNFATTLLTACIFYIYIYISLSLYLFSLSLSLSLYLFLSLFFFSLSLRVCVYIYASSRLIK